MELITTFTVFWTCYISLIVYMVALSFFEATFDFFKDQRIPGPKPLPVIGNWWNIWKKKSHELDIERYKQYGRIFGTYDGRTPNAFVGDPKIIKKVLSDDFGRFKNRRNLSVAVEKYLNENLMVLKDEEWKRCKMSMTSLFASENLKEMGILMNESIEKFVSALPEFAYQKEINLKTALVPFINFTIGFCGFGMKVNTQGRYFSPFPKRFTLPKFSKLLSIHALYPNIGRVIRKLFPKKYKQEGMEYYLEIAKNILKGHRSGKETTKRRSGNLMDILLRESDNVKGEKNPLKDDNKLIGHLLHLMISGFEVNYMCICLTLHCLAMKRSAQDKVREEIRKGLEKHKTICHELVEESHYLDQCINEALRMYPPIVRAERVCNERVNYKGSIGFCKGCIITIPIFAIHRDPEYFPNPDVFDPDRFSSENKSKIQPFTYLPFGEGPRSCFGMKYALEFTKLTISNLILNYRFFPIHSTVDPPNFSEGTMGFLKFDKLLLGIEQLRV